MYNYRNRDADDRGRLGAYNPGCLEADNSRISSTAMPDMYRSDGENSKVRVILLRTQASASSV
jgi:hypothetical protein